MDEWVNEKLYNEVREYIETSFSKWKIDMINTTLPKYAIPFNKKEESD